MNRTLTTGRIVISGAFALSIALGSAGTAMATGHDGATQPTKQSSAKQDPAKQQDPAKKQDQAKQTTPHAEEADGSDHGATGKPAKDDPNPGKGKDCVQHGNHGGVNEDHCGPADRPDGPATPKPGDTKPGDTKPGDTKPGDTKPGDTKPGDTKPETPTTETPTTEDTTPQPTPSEEPTPGHECNICKTVTPPAPVVVPVCGADNDQVTLPDAKGVIWDRGEWSNGTLVVKAVSADWYTFPTGDLIVHTIKDANVPCGTTPTTPPVEDCDNTCPTPTTPTTPAPEKPVTQTPAPVKPTPVTPTPVKVKPVGHTPVAVTPVTPFGVVVTETPAKATANGAPVFNSGVEGDESGLGAGALGAGLAVAAGLMMVPAIRRRQSA